jgi:hypothetical protein
MKVSVQRIDLQALRDYTCKATYKLGKPTYHKLHYFGFAVGILTSSAVFYASSTGTRVSFVDSIFSV